MSDTIPRRRVFIKTLGCQMNVYDTGKILAHLAEDGFEPTSHLEEADLVLVNTCSVREKPEHKLRSFLGTIPAHGGRRPMVGVAGCMASHGGDKLYRSHPEVDLVFGPDAIPRVRELVREARRRRVLDHRLREAEGYPFPRLISPDAGARVADLVTIQKGCDNRCTYCIVPFTRGPEASRPSGEVLEEARALLDRGVRDLTLLGQNVNGYGARRPGELDFPSLLREVHALPGLARLRFTTSHPKDFHRGLMESYATLPLLADHLHLPLQSGSSAVLRRMGRGYTRDDYLRLVDTLRMARPGIVLSTDFIVGFPGETDEDFQRSLSILEEIGFDASFSFCFSPRPHTAALELHRRDPVPRSVAAARLKELQALQADISLQNHRALVGSRMEVLIEGPSRQDAGVMAGRSSCFRTVNVEADERLVGRLVPVEITGATVHSLVGTIHGDAGPPDR